MTVYSLINNYYIHHPKGHYFHRDTLKWFGERISEMRVFKETVQIRDSLGEIHTCYVLSKLSRNHPYGKRRTYAYFDVDTFDVI